MKKAVRLLRPWFALTVQERWFIAGILAIVLVGLAARWAHLRGERPVAYQPVGVEEGAQP